MAEDIKTLALTIVAQQLLMEATWRYLARTSGLDMEIAAEVIKEVQIPLDRVELDLGVSLEQTTNLLECFLARLSALPQSNGHSG